MYKLTVLFYTLFAGYAWSQPFQIFAVRNSDNAARFYQVGTGVGVSGITSPPATTLVELPYLAIPPSKPAYIDSDDSHVLPYYRYVNGILTLRPHAAVAAEASVVAQVPMREALYAAQTRLMAIQQLAVKFPQSQRVQADQAAAQAAVVSVQQSIGLTTATTQ